MSCFDAIKLYRFVQKIKVDIHITSIIKYNKKFIIKKFNNILINILLCKCYFIMLLISKELNY